MVIGESRGGIYCFSLPAFGHDLISDGRCRNDEREFPLATQSLRNDLKMKHSQKSAPEASAKEAAGFFFIGKRRIGKAETVNRLPERVKAVLAFRKDGSPHDRFGTSIAGKRRPVPFCRENRIPYGGNARLLHAGRDVTDLARR